MFYSRNTLNHANVLLLKTTDVSLQRVAFPFQLPSVPAAVDVHATGHGLALVEVSLPVLCFFVEGRRGARKISVFRYICLRIRIKLLYYRGWHYSVLQI